MTEIEKQEKFLELIEPIRDKLYMYAMALERSSCDAEDLVGETLLACYEAFGNIEDHSSFKAYVFKTARNTFRRKSQRKWLFGVFDQNWAERIPSNERSPDFPLEIEMLYKALDKLPAKQKEAVVLFEISGFSQNEICKIQNSTLSAVKARIKRGREKLQAIMLSDELPDSGFIIKIKAI